VGGFDEDFFLYYEEIDLCRRLRDHGWQVFHLPEASAVHHLNRSGAQRPALTFLARQQSRLRFHAKHRGPVAFLALRTMLGAKVAAAGLRRRVSPRARSAGDLDAAYYAQVLRWCRTPGSLPAGPPCVIHRAEERVDRQRAS
jgi:GT2 family glycosyltransferase